MVGPATGKARPPTVDSFTHGTSRGLVRAERRERRQADRRHEPADSGMTAQFHEYMSTVSRPSVAAA